MSDYSLPVIYSIGLQESISHLCKLINSTILSHTSDILPIQAELSCDSVVVEYYIPWLLLVTMLLCLLTIYMAYYHCVIVGAPKVVCSDPHRLDSLIKHCPVFFEKYRPTIWAPLSYMQTIIRVALQTFPKEERRRERLTMASDGGHMCLDWYNERSFLQPTVLFLPGITGSSDENYIRHWIQDMTQLGYRSIVFNYRGCGYTKLSTPRLYCGSNISDLIEAVEHIKTKLPHAPLIAVGVSLGTMKLIKLVSDYKIRGRASPFKAMLLISAIWNIIETDKVIHKPFNKHTLNRHLCNNFKDILRENREVFEESTRKNELCFDYYKSLKCTTFRDFTEVVILPMFGYLSITEVFTECCPSSRLKNITIPVLGLNSADDPFTPPHAIPERVANGNRHLMLVTTRRGGHIGFMDRLFPFGKTLMDRALIEFTTAVFEHGAF